MITKPNKTQDLLLKLKQTALNHQCRVDTLVRCPNLGKHVSKSEEVALLLGMTRSQLKKLAYQRVRAIFKPTGMRVILVRQELIEWQKSSGV